MSTIQVRVNGTHEPLPPGLTVAELVARLGLAPDGVAVAINLHVVPKSQHPTRALREGDRVEIVQAVGGG